MSTHIHFTFLNIFFIVNLMLCFVAEIAVLNVIHKKSLLKKYLKLTIVFAVEKSMDFNLW